jgi:succinoglycan biosynthesis transport protein ExoP
VLPAGLRQPNPAELLSGQRFSDLLAWAESCYDRVLVDCPPVLAVSDAQVVGRLVDGAILVVRPEKNHRRLVVRACESFSATGSKVLGVVANGLTSQAGGYSYGYGYGYGHETEQAQRKESADDDVITLAFEDEVEALTAADSDQAAARSSRRQARAA